MSIIKSTPKVWDFMYDNPKIFKKSESIKKFLHKTSHKKVGKLIDKFKPDAIVCTQAFPCGMVADFKTEHDLKVPLVGVLTDYAPHSYWLNEGVDYYVVPSDDAKERFVQKGVNPNVIKVFGIPLRPRFLAPVNRDLVAQKIGFNPNSPTVLVMGGGQGLGPIKNIVKSLISMTIDAQIIVIAGTNKKIIKSLHKYAKKSSKKILIYEYVDNVFELMSIASLIITKPGGMTTAECLAKGLPMVIVNSLPGQEMRNTDFLINKGVALRIDETKDVGEEVELLLRSPQRLHQMRQAALVNAKPTAAIDIARLILQGIK